MAFDNKKGPGSGGNQSGFSAPFGSGSQQSKSGASKSGGSSPFSRDSQSSQRSSFSNLPATTERNTPAPRRDSTDIRRVSSGFDASSIPWKAIILLALVIVALVLVICFWDVITYVVTNIIAMLIVIVILLLVIRGLFQRR